MRRAFAGACLALVAACAEDTPPEPVPSPPPEPAKAVVLTVERLELGRTATGYALAAFGATDGASWSAPELRPAPQLVAADGYLVFDFVARPPGTPVPAAEPATRLRADRAFAAVELQGAAGLRVRGVANAASLALR